MAGALGWGLTPPCARRVWGCTGAAAPWLAGVVGVVILIPSTEQSPTALWPRQYRPLGGQKDVSANTSRRFMATWSAGNPGRRCEYRDGVTDTSRALAGAGSIPLW